MRNSTFEYGMVFLALCCLVFAGCGGGGATTIADTTAPTISSTSPASNASGVAVNGAISATFSEAMDASTITSSSFTVKDANNNAVSGAVNYAGTSATFTPAADFAYATAYTATISTGAKDVAGNALTAAYSWSFTTGTAPDTTAPTVSSTSPESNATGVAVNGAVSATFSEAMDPATFTVSSFLLKDGSNNAVSGAVNYAGTTATFTPSVNLAYSAGYTATVTTTVKDLAGNAPAAAYSWSFTTGAAPDTTPPTVTSTSPAGSATGVAVDGAVSVTFSEAMKAETITTGSFLLKDAGNNAVSGTVIYSAATATFTPSANLAYATLYTATVTTAAVDLAGNGLATNATFTFTTAAAPNVAFVTSVTGNGNLSSWADAGGKTGLAAADAICQARATAGGLTGTFKAWMSDTSDDAYCRMHDLTGHIYDKCGQGVLPASAGPWVRTDGTPFAPTIDKMTAQRQIYSPLAYDEFGIKAPAGSAFHTGTSETGEYVYGGMCTNWTVSNFDAHNVGFIYSTTYGWTAGSGNCNSSAALACFQIGNGGPLPAFTATGRKAFITSTKGTGNLGSWADSGGNTGVAAGDAICQARASAAGLANAAKFKAWLSDGTAAMDSRLTGNGPWLRLDGMVMAKDKTELMSGSLPTSINVTETGVYVGDANSLAWTGTKSDGTAHADTCNGWTDATNGMSGLAGMPYAANLWWTFFTLPTCDTQASLYCLED
ncbi:MAG: Ig-like domain-containing protein [Nitrospirota bacterium]|nr:Ig-like domain-containing protein [Nitrospirota bacterium]